MNEYFTPKTPEPRVGAFDIVLRAMIGLIAALIIGVGIWTTIDSLKEKPAPRKAAGPEGTEASDTNAMTHAFSRSP